VIIGTDCLEINHKLINNTFNFLNNHHMVIGPATDGGYYLIGLNKIYYHIFNDIDWSTDKVLKQTLVKARDLNIKYKLLDFKNDIDILEDLRNYRYLLI
jgi:glycosyltransferase A (GT-A) superfamily protein (DUF2064 family)